VPFEQLSGTSSGSASGDGALGPPGPLRSPSKSTPRSAITPPTCGQPKTTSQSHPLTALASTGGADASESTTAMPSAVDLSMCTSCPTVHCPKQATRLEGALELRP